MTGESANSRVLWGSQQIARHWFGLSVFLVALVLLLSAVPFGDFFTIVGDNIAQVAYWKSLFHRQFVGSIGASVVKPGLIAVLGISHDLSLALLGSSLLVRVVFALTAAALVSVVAGIARDVSGTFVAGYGAALYLLVATPIPRLFTDGSSMIFFFPLLFGGVWAFARQRQLLGSIVLCVAALIRLEAFAVLLWLSISEQLLKSRWRNFLLTAGITAATVLLTAGVYYAVQGSVARFGAGGPATGYLLARDADVLRRIWTTLVFSFTAPYQIAFEQCGFPYLALPAGYALFRDPHARSYAALLAVPLFWLVCVALGQGQNEVRYFEFVIPVLAAFGAAGVVVAFRDGRDMTRPRRVGLASIALVGLVASLLLSRLPVAISAAMVAVPALLGWLTTRIHWSPKLLWLRIGYTVLIVGALVATVMVDGFGSPRKVASYVKDAEALLRQKLLPRGTAVLTEDDIIYNVVVKDVGYFGGAAALQDFNLQPEARRRELLGKTDYVVISKGRHSWYYLRYDPQKLGKNDQFRAAVSRLMKSKQPVSIYGRLLVPVRENRNFLVLKVEPHVPSRG